ncbi:hypothetical protein M438DRAFT_392764 [Aureobasidium pullulans EXF-150]|uniref:Arrestin C-terminal-like domain-containing protein n=1 Tax=Aureobasidium pullulans EXF-150 TaxID=1043002 RepID=A0A074XRM3_AURPU|nr:uncharacterized protein M438DRAFT_392764 [Aureobasidium pullulans EXF-150]KEQ84617.1 hypothetical protein M438DRAFT_392764 [Aureobasidium pullulans EXF-150]
MRPLSDIRELTEPSLVDALEKRPSASVHRQPSITRQSSLRRGPSLKRAGSVRIVEPIGSSSSSYREDMMASESTIDTPESLRDGSSLYSIPISSIPARQSSNIRERPRHHRSTTSRSSPTPLQRNASRTIPYRGTSHSPVKQVRARLDAVGSDTSRRVPSGTFIRNPVPRDILEFPTHRHPRIGVDLQIGAPLFVGGGTVEGYVRVIVDEADKPRNKKSLTLGRIAVDLVGTEETSSNRKAIFLSLGTELIDSTHPPPRNMVEPQDFPDDDCFWSLIPSFTSLPFVISLPLDTGPPPFHSKHARIRFVLCATVLIKDGGRQYLVRCSEDISVLPTYDPEKALRSLPSPLTASDEQSFSRSGLLETAKITAGLHRQVWVSGSSIFVDIHIANGSRKTIKKLELSLERDILCYRHAAAATLEQSASQARIFESNERSILSKHTMKQGANGWTGVEAYGSITRTCDLEIPRGHATVKCGNYFEVRYFLNITIGGFHRKMLSVQLPIIVIHMNSLDVLPNSVAQVAAAIEEKRSHHRSHRRTASQASAQSKPSRLQGRAFAAPRQQSLERMRASAADLRQLEEELESSPRKHQISSNNGMMEYITPPSKRKEKFFSSPLRGEGKNVGSALKHVRSIDSFRSHKSTTTRWRDHFGKDKEGPPPRPPPPPPSGPITETRAMIQQQHASAPYMLGLVNSAPLRPNRSSLDQGIRDQRNEHIRLPDKSRFEFKAVTRKSSGLGLKSWLGERLGRSSH